jgi:hypothetical protein
MVQRRLMLSMALVWLASVAIPAQAQGTHRERPLDVHAWRIVPRESGNVDYYTIVNDPVMPYVHAQYRPPFETAVLGIELPKDERKSAQRLRWSWRAITLPLGGNECVAGKEDSAATIYITWRRGLRYYGLKYVWSSVAPKGVTCDRKRSPFVAQDTIILESGGPLNTWRTEEVDLNAEFRKHFENGDPNAEVPGLLGFGLMSDGDQTHSDSAADYAAFTVVF